MVGDEERGLFASKDIKAGEVLARVPISNLIIRSQSKSSIQEKLNSIKDDLKYQKFNFKI